MPQGSNDPNRCRPDAVTNGPTAAAGNGENVVHRPFRVRLPLFGLERPGS